MNTNTQSVYEMHGAVMSEALSNESFRANLTSDPKATLKDALGVDIPDSVEVHIHESSDNAVHLVLPPSDALNEEDLAQVAAGLKHCSSYRDDEKFSQLIECTFSPHRW